MAALPSLFPPRVRGWRAGVAVLLVLGAAVLALSRMRKPAVAVVTPVTRDVVELLVVSGRVRAERQSDMGAEIGGVVERVYVDEGVRVTTGALLMELRSAQAEAELAQSERKLETAQKEMEAFRTKVRPAELERLRELVRAREATRHKAEQDLQRQAELFKKTVVSRDDLDTRQREFDDADAQLNVAKKDIELLLQQPRPEELATYAARVHEAEADVALKKQRLDQHKVRAPFAGLVAARTVEPGQSITAGQSLFVLADERTLEIYVETDENNLGKLRTGQTATIVTAVAEEHQFPARVKRIESRVDRSRGVIGVRLGTDRFCSNIRLDMTVDVNIEVRRAANTLALPPSAVQTRGGRTLVYRVERDVARSTPVGILARAADWIALDGIDAGQRYVLDGSVVADGMRIRASDEGRRQGNGVADAGAVTGAPGQEH